MRRQACIFVALFGACGPEVRETPEIQPWMSGIWSLALMTEYEMTPGPDGGIGENNDHQPARFEIFGDGTYEVFTSVGPGTYATFESTWEIVAKDEILADRYEAEPESMLAHRWQFGTGERGCDTIEVTTRRDDGELRPFNLYRGAVCTVQKEPCPPDAIPPHNCFYYHYTWCDEQGANERWTEGYGEDTYCHLPGYEEGE